MTVDDACRVAQELAQRVREELLGARSALEVDPDAVSDLAASTRHASAMVARLG